MYETYIQPFITYISDGSVMKNDFAVAGLMSGAFYAIISYISPIPGILWSRIKRQIVYSTTIEQSDELYLLVSKLLMDKYPKKVRVSEAFIKNSYGEHWEADDYNDTKNKVIQYNHFSDFFFIFHDGNVLKIEKEREKLENAKSFSQAYLGRLKISGFFAEKAIKSLLQNSLRFLPKLDEEDIVIKNIWTTHWVENYVYTNKTVDKLFFPEKSHILSLVDNFQKSRGDYYKRGIEWYLGILLSGIPGNGKSSLATSLAKYTDRDLYVINLASMSDGEFTNAFTSIGKNALLVLDDIDVSVPKRTPDNNMSIELESKVNLATLLSCLDGSLSRSDIIVVMTTNNKSELDLALIRKGRVDVDVTMSYPDKKSVIDYLKCFFETNSISNTHNLPNNYNISMSVIQNICLNSESVESAVEEIINIKQ